VEIPVSVSLLTVGVIILTAIVLSVLVARHEKKQGGKAPAPERSKPKK
jgi:hypothetical protein